MTLLLAHRTAIAQTVEFAEMSPKANLFRFAPTGPHMSKGQCFDPVVGYGFEPIDDPATSNAACLFSVVAEEGWYRVTVLLGGGHAANNTIKAESRQLMLHNLSTNAGETCERSFLVQVRTPRVNRKTRVHLNAGEASSFRWDAKLTLEFNGTAPLVEEVRIEPIERPRTVFLVGDSTVCDQPAEPWAGWGQMLPTMLRTDSVTVSNHAESGQSFTKFFREKRWFKIQRQLRAGDVVMIQMGHNDQKETGDSAGAFRNFKASMERLIRETRDAGATPVLVTPMHRRLLDDAGRLQFPSSDYPAAVRQVAQQMDVPLIDLRDASEALYKAIGDKRSTALFVDPTHHNSYGAYLLARCVVDTLRDGPEALSNLVREDLPRLEFGRLPAEREVHVPPSPLHDPTPPAGK